MSTKIKSTTEYKTLFAALGNEESALAAYAQVYAKTDPRVADLVSKGLTQAQAEAAVKAADATPAPAEVDPTKALVEGAGYTFTKGRVYTNPALVEAQARVLKTGKSEIVQSSGVGRTKAVLVSREESGDLSLQNLVPQA